MPTEEEITNFLPAIVPVSRANLPAEIECPICMYAYITEYPVHIRNPDPDSKCNHIFGNLCIEKHVRGGGSRSTKCPICRKKWFHSETEVEEDVEMSVLDAIDDEERVRGRGWDQSGEWKVFDDGDIVRVPIPRRVRVRIGVAGGSGSRDQEHGEDEHMPARNDRRQQHEVPNAQGLSNRGKVNQSIGFLERILMTSEIDEGVGRIDHDVENLQRAIARLWTAVERYSEEIA